MLLFSFKKPFHVGHDGVVINNLARNHKYKKKGNHLVVETFDIISNKNYEIYYSLSGIFEFVRISFNHHYFDNDATLKTHYVFETQIINNSGDTLLEKSDYISGEKNELLLRNRSFVSTIGNETTKKEFLFDQGKWKAEGNIPQKHFKHWMKY